MENISYINKSVLVQEEREDFTSDTLYVEELQLMKDIRKRKAKLIGLGSVYVILILASFAFLT